jgi:two-component system nitrate/nitrite sensor histidine kinase NarX
VLSGAENRLRLVGSLGLPADLCTREPAVDRHCGHCGVAAEEQHVVWAADLADCAGRSSNAYFAQAGLRLLAVPLQHRGQTLGVYSLFFAGSDEPGPDAQALLKSVGELLGLALNNARLEQENLRARLASERQMLAADVHDSLAQSLVFVKMRLPLLQDAMQAHDDARAQQYCTEVRQVVSQAHANLRSILTHLRAPMDPQGLVHALGVSAENFRRNTGAELDLAIALPALALAPEQEAQVFHIVQEALQNVARHAHANHAWVRLSADAAGELEIVIEDDGAGLPAAAAGGGSHYGMEIMAERARRLGGALDVGARPGGGTRVRLAFPAAAARGDGVNWSR